MVICICKGVNEKQVIQASKGGRCDMKQVRCELGIGKQCGKCMKLARGVLDKCRQSKCGA